MRVLWFEITEPSRYRGGNSVLSGWQDSLEQILLEEKRVELIVAFESSNPSDEVKTIDGITYVPLHFSYSLSDKIKKMISWGVVAKKTIKKAKSVIDAYRPDLVHVFGCEWPYGLVAKFVEIPVVIHIQGSIVALENALYPPKYNIWNYIKYFKLNLPRILGAFIMELNNASRKKMESEVWSVVDNYMGRTHWDFALSKIMNKNRSYFHVDEMIRPLFLSSQKKWKVKVKNDKIKLFSIGCAVFWKGMDMMLKTAKVLKSAGVDFEWNVAGGDFSKSLKGVIEKTEDCKYIENNVHFVGSLPPQDLIEYLTNTTIYVHTAYMENSPNSICEAMLLGVPVISTNVGGISTLLGNGECGVLVPANDPWQMAYAILSLSTDNEKMEYYSKKGMEIARERHSAENIRKQLLNCYETLTN